MRVTGAPPASLGTDLRRLMHRLRDEAGIDIYEAAPGTEANITIQAVSRAQIRRALPHAACFVVPNITDISQYRPNRRSVRTSWSNLRTRNQLAIFLPNDSSPQEVRDCLHEELAQAIGPLNDLYRLPDSVFNDDNVHTVLTGFDMLILKAYYAPELRSGMTRGQVAAKLPGILARINPDGEGMPAQFATRTPRAWSDAVQTALGPGQNPPNGARPLRQRLRSPKQWVGPTTAAPLPTMQMAAFCKPPTRKPPKPIFAPRTSIMPATKGASLHRAYVATQLAAYEITRGDGDSASVLLAPHIDQAARNENAALLSTLLLLRAEALDLQGRSAEAQSVRLDSLGWARYGFGPDWAVRAKLRENIFFKPAEWLNLPPQAIERQGK